MNRFNMRNKTRMTAKVYTAKINNTTNWTLYPKKGTYDKQIKIILIKAHLTNTFKCYKCL